MSFIMEWFTNILDYFGFYRKSGKLLFIGLDNAGKTTLMMKIHADKLSQPTPTHYPTSENFRVGKINFTVFDLGGHEIARLLWKQYFPVANGIVFVIDAADSGRLDEARTELLDVLTDEEIASVPILVLGNKVDKPAAMSEEALKASLGISKLCTGKGENPCHREGRRPLEVFMCSVHKSFGYGAGFLWISQYFE